MDQISDTHRKSLSTIEADEKATSTWGQTLSIETGGIERVTPDQRQENVTHFWNACTFWYEYTSQTVIREHD